MLARQGGQVASILNGVAGVKIGSLPEIDIVSDGGRVVTRASALAIAL